MQSKKNEKELYNTVKKFTDLQFIELYNKGLNDIQTANIFRVWGSTVTRRRLKLKLLSNATQGVKIKDELDIENFLDREKEVYKLHYSKNLPKIRQAWKKWHKRPEYKKHRREYLKRPDVAPKRQKLNKLYYINHREDISEKYAKYYKRNQKGLIQLAREYREKNKEKIRLSGRKRYKTQKRITWTKEYLKRPESKRRAKKSRSKYYKKNKQEIREKAKRKYKEKKLRSNHAIRDKNNTESKTI